MLQRSMILAAVVWLGVSCGGSRALTDGRGTAGASGGYDGGGIGGGGIGGGRDDGGAATAGKGPMTSVPNLHRAVATECPHDRPAPTCVHAPPSPLPPSDGGCNVDTDCVGGTNGRCVSDEPFILNCGVCSYDVCFTDSDCNGAGPCDCHSGFRGANVCSPGSCRVDADCGVGGYCSPSLPSCPGYPDIQGKSGFFCHKPTDECFDDSDCSQSRTNICRYDGTTSAWRCMEFEGCPA
jgi:hypothetical protein